MFRLLLRVGEAAREGGSAAGRVDLVGCLKEILATQGITLVENDDDETAAEETRSVVIGSAQHVNGSSRPPGGRKKDDGRRRVSFDDARLDETWLSEHSRSLVSSPPHRQDQRALLSQPPRRGRYPESLNGRRARSTSSQRTHLMRQADPKHVQQASRSTVYTSDHDDTNFNPTLLFQPSQTQLEQNAEAFASTSVIRSGRRCLHIWHDTALLVHQAREQAYAIAAAHDRRTLLKQAFDQWRTNHAEQVQARNENDYWKRREKEAYETYVYNKLRPAFTHWHTSTLEQKKAVAVGKQQVLMVRYFHRWRAIAVENATKARSILSKKFIAVWREKVARKILRDEQATAHYEENVTKQCWKAWFWHFCSRRVEGCRGEKLKRRALSAWSDRARGLQQKGTLADGHYRAVVTCGAFSRLKERLAQCQEDVQQARTHRDRVLTASCLQTLSLEAKLNPLGRTLMLKIRLDLQRRAFRIWHLQLTISRQAKHVDHKRVLQSAWTSWNDALRCKALGQRIDERVLVEALYRWVLAARLKLFQRNIDARLLREVVHIWSGEIREVQHTTATAEVAFADAQQRRRMAFGMRKLHMAVRKREDAERAAVEFANSRALPNVLQILAEKTRLALRLEKWAIDAQFYTLCTRTLAVWRERTAQRVHERRRDAYATVRARIKIRLVASCLSSWHTKAAHLVAINKEAERRAHERLFTVGTEAFDSWRSKTARLQQLDEQATALDYDRLLTSAFSALTSTYAQRQAMDVQAETFRHDTDLAVLAAALKKVQWAQFTAARRAESAEALWTRNRDQHVRHWLRGWYVQAFDRRSAKQAETAAAAQVEEEPDSPSLRPASRAASRSRERHPASSPLAFTPASIRTPSRARRAGRLRPLPTPAPGTPFAMDTAYLTTTPAPLPGGLPDVGLDTLTPQVTPFARKLRAGGFAATPAPALRSSVFGRSAQGTAKSVRFAGGSRFGGHEKSS